MKFQTEEARVVIGQPPIEQNRPMTSLDDDATPLIKMEADLWM